MDFRYAGVRRSFFVVFHCSVSTFFCDPVPSSCLNVHAILLAGVALNRSAQLEWRLQFAFRVPSLEQIKQYWFYVLFSSFLSGQLYATVKRVSSRQFNFIAGSNVCARRGVGAGSLGARIIKVPRPTSTFLIARDGKDQQPTQSDNYIRE